MLPLHQYTFLLSRRCWTKGMTKTAQAAILYVIAGVVSGATSASPVLSAVSDTARFNWEIPQGGLGTGASFYVVSPAGGTVFIVTGSGNFIPLPGYSGRLVYQGNIAVRNVTFTLSNIQTSDAGTYTCGNGGGTATDVIQNCGQKLVVLGKPTTPGRPVSTTPVYNQQMTLTCSSTSTSVPADHGLTLTYTWQRDNTDITVTSPGSPYTFTVSSLDSHSYRCRARESRGLESEWSQVYHMEPQYGPYQISRQFQTPPSLLLLHYPANISMFTANSHSGSVTVNESDTVTLRCQIDSNPRSVITLLNGTEELTRTDNSLSATYRLESADCRQRGNYSCTATNNIGAPVTQTWRWSNVSSPRLDDSVSQQLKFASRLGGDVAVSVSVLAYPLPTFTWSRSISTSQDLTGSSSPVSDISVTARLHLTNLQQQDFGDYSLTVDNGVGSSVTYTVSVVPADPTDQQRLGASCNCTGVTAGATVGTFLLTLLIGGIVLMVLYRKGYRVGNILKGAARKSSSHPEPVEMDNKGYSSLDQITAPAQYSNLGEESEKQQYTQLKIYENTKADTAADTSTYEGVTKTPPVTYESLRASTYQNTGAHSQDPEHGNA
ncbi:uncharacterized protein PB18E9.04c-like [Haliotis rubra]|uniref:uncharacterized protein PB18E9.04c-like n=1 Tax=Haliotis rubra TaxID=36100 RepID=UPI001EE511B1|nr:uncharacterized protein PB18E9.04c-like [Haliotis rubra]